MNYINMKGNYGIETVEDLRQLNLKERKRLLGEYRLSDPYNRYYFSYRSTKEFREN